MHCVLTGLRSLLADRAGSINIIAALCAPVVLMMAAFGLDHGNLILAKRTLQEHADLAAIAGVSDIDDAEAVVLDHFQNNGVAFAVRDGAKMLTVDGTMSFNEALAFKKYGGYAVLVRGHYTADATLAPTERFVADAYPRDALKVTIRQAPKLYFPGVLSAEPRLGAAGTASVSKVATVAVLSRLASLDAGLINRVLGALLGTTISLSVMDSQALAQTDVSVLAFTEQMAADLHLEALNYEQLLATEVTFNEILVALSKSPNLSASARTALTRLAQQASKTKAKLRLEQLLNLGPYGKRLVGSITGLELKAGLMEIINAAAGIANAGRQVNVDLDSLVPGLVTAKLTLLIGEPEVEAPYFAVARPGAAVRTAQTRLKLVADVNGLSALAGLKLRLPIYVDVAKAEAKISAVNCTSGLSAATASADVQAKPTLAEITLGDVDEDAFFGLRDTNVGMTTLVDSALVRIRAKSRVTAANAQATTLRFSSSDIKAQKVKSISTTSPLEPMTNSLFSDLALEVQVLNATLGTPQVVAKALAPTLSAAAKPIDDVLFGVLSILGVKVGEADIRVGSASCQRPVVVN